MDPISVTSPIDLSIIRRTDTEAHTLFLYKMAQSNVQATSTSFFQSLDEMFDHALEAGKSPIDDNGQLVTWDTMLDRLEKAHVAFNEKGEPILPKLYSGTPEQIDHLTKTRAPEYERRFWEIIEQKKAVYYAKERTRRLS
jgi:hypothetical protein